MDLIDAQIQWQMNQEIPYWTEKYKNSFRIE
jgi:hypothetical protein